MLLIIASGSAQAKNTAKLKNILKIIASGSTNVKNYNKWFWKC